MRLLRSLLVLILLLPAPAWAAIAEIAGKKVTCAGNNVDSVACVAGGAVAIGDFIVVTGASWHTAPQNTSIAVAELSSPTVPTYTVKFYADTTSTSRGSVIAYGFVTTAGTPTVTIDPNGTGNFICASVDVFSGVHATPLDVDPGYLNGTGTTVSQNITTAANALIVGIAQNENLRDFTPGASYTQIGEDNTAESCNSEYRIVTSATTYAVDWALAVGGGWTSQVISFAPAGAPGGSTIKHRVIQ